MNTEIFGFSGMQAVPSKVCRLSCVEEHRLIKRFETAVKELQQHHDAQLDMLLKFGRLLFEQQIEQAEAKRRGAKQALLEHHRQHRCGAWRS